MLRVYDVHSTGVWRALNFDEEQPLQATAVGFIFILTVTPRNTGTRRS